MFSDWSTHECGRLVNFFSSLLTMELVLVVNGSVVDEELLVTVIEGSENGLAVELGAMRDMGLGA
jgi:hypothetical protein